MKSAISAPPLIDRGIGRVAVECILPSTLTRASACIAPSAYVRLTIYAASYIALRYSHLRSCTCFSDRRNSQERAQIALSGYSLQVRGQKCHECNSIKGFCALARNFPALIRISLIQSKLSNGNVWCPSATMCRDAEGYQCWPGLREAQTL